MSEPVAPTSRRHFALLLALVLLPAAIFYAVLCSLLTNIPIFDDYAILVFLTNLTQIHGEPARLIFILTTQFNEYKVMLGAIVFATEYAILGHMNFLLLCLLGNASVLLLGWVLWKMFLPQAADLRTRLALFIPVSWILFQLSYSETLNWSAPAIQNLYVLVFSFAAFLFVARTRRSAFIAVLLCVVLAIAASGNGFIAAAVIGLALLFQRRFLRLMALIAVTVGMVLLYAYHYDAMSSQSSAHESVFRVLLHLKITYIFSFLGGAGIFLHLIPHFSPVVVCLISGCLLSIFFACAMVRWGLASSPAVLCAILFVFLTAVGVAGIRSDLGIQASLAPRYRIYSDLLLVLAWFLICEHAMRFVKPVSANRIYIAACAAAILFSLVGDVMGTHYLILRRNECIAGLRLYEHPDPAQPLQGPMFTEGSHTFLVPASINHIARDILAKSAALGIYHPPAY